MDRKDKFLEHRASGFSAVSRRDFLQGSTQAAVLAGVSASLLSAPIMAHAADAGLVALVHTQAAGDNGPIDSLIGGLKKLAAEKNFPTRTIYAQDPATFESILKSLGQANAAVVITTFLQMAEPMKAVAPNFPKTKFVMIYADPFEPAIPNVATVAYNYYLGCYLSGIFGAKISKTGKLGYIGGASVPPLNADLNALIAGAASVDPKVTVASAFAGSFQDPAKGHEIAAQMYQSGVDFIQTDAAATDGGIFEAANESPGSMACSNSNGEFKLGPKTVIAAVNLDWGLSLYNSVSATFAADWKGGHRKTGLDDGVIDFFLSDQFEKEGPADLVAKAKQLWPDIEKAKKDVVSGAIKVPFKTTLG